MPAPITLDDMLYWGDSGGLKFVPLAPAAPPPPNAPAAVSQPPEPAVTRLSESGAMRLRVVSFFAMAFLLSAAGVRLLWNWLRRDFPFLPRLSYPKAVGLTGLWGLLFILVLTMISGARELMTPAAWVRNGITYRVAYPVPATTATVTAAMPTAGIARPEAANTPPDPAATAYAEAAERHRRRPATEAERRQGLEVLRASLWFASPGEEAAFPLHDLDPAVPAPSWRVPGDSGLRYIYVPGLSKKGPAVPLAYEPDVFGDGRFVLMTDGSVVRKPISEIKSALIEATKALRKRGTP
jgi:hypothetical protein